MVCDKTPLVLQLGDERVELSGFVASCPARVEPCNGVQQNSKVRTTTDKSWPKLEVLPDGSGELAVNPLIALDELAKSEFPGRRVPSTKNRRAVCGMTRLSNTTPALTPVGIFVAAAGMAAGV